MDSRVRASPEQFLTLLEYMESHGDLARPQSGPQGRIRSDRLWTDLTVMLNAVGGGVHKTTEKWKKVWADLKSKTKKKALAIRRHASGTGGGPANRQTLTQLDERVLAIMGPLAVDGQASVEELGFNRPQISAPSQPQNTVEQDQMFFEIIDELPTRESLPALAPTLQIETVQAPIVACTSSQEQPPTPPPPAPAPAPATPPRRRRLAIPRAGATPPSGQRGTRPTTPATPQSTASPRRPRVRARRRHAPTPFERAASEFAAVEMRRLELEETRNRQQHERDMRALDVQHERDIRALEVEHERNQVFTSMVAIAREWLDFYRSRDSTEPLNTV